MRLDVYVNYAGVCEEAFHLYEQHLGGKITLLGPARRPARQP